MIAMTTRSSMSVNARRERADTAYPQGAAQEDEKPPGSSILAPTPGKSKTE